MNDLGLKIETITKDNIESILSDPRVPKTVMEKLDKLLLFIYRRTKQLYDEVIISINTPAIGYAKNKEELESMVKALSKKGYYGDYIKPGFIEGTRALTLDGLQRAESLQKEVVNSKQCFVAMWFSDEMKSIYDNFITKAVEDAGYQPLIISQKEHNDDICDQIIAEIRKSKFLIADFTGNRGGVYYEAGFALGLGLPVIWTCREDDLKDVHFDVNHKNIIVWKTGDDLYEKLKYRIQATII
jgi:hypothetical protein